MSETETLSSAVKGAINSRLLGVHFCLPGLIVSFDNLTRRCSVQPALQRRLVDEPEPLNLPVLEDIPVKFPRSSKFAIEFELEKDDIVTLIFAERSLEKWLEKGGIVDPNKTDIFSLSDAIAIPGLLTTPATWAAPIESGCISIRNKTNTTFVKLSDTEIEAKNSKGNIKLDNAGTVEINGNLKVLV